jgi:hypothetical protein
MQKQYAGHWEKPEWIYDQILKIEKRIDEPEMLALKERSAAMFQQKMASEHAEFFQHYTKIFFRAINKCLNKQLLLMALKQRKKIDTGEVSFQEGNQEAIGAAFNLMLRKLPEDLREKVANTYTDLVEEERREQEAAIREKLAELNGDGVDANTAPTDQQVKETIRELHTAPQRVEEVDAEGTEGTEGIETKE